MLQLLISFISISMRRQNLQATKKLHATFLNVQARNCRVEGGSLPCPFLKKSVLILGKSVMTVSIYGLNISLKMEF